jgi:pimeloyl-ACP methyl ester carboxylesterase
MPVMFDGLQLDHVGVGDVTLRVRYGGEGEPAVLLHGHPRTHTTWHRVAPKLSGAVEQLAVMDGLPVIEHLERLNEAFVRTWWHSWFLGQTDKFMPLRLRGLPMLGRVAGA